MIQGALLDVGGTLWPNNWPVAAGDDDERAARLVALSPTADLAAARRLAVRLDRQPDPPDGDRQIADTDICRALEEEGLEAVFGDLTAVRRAICLPASGHLAMLDGAASLLRRLRDNDIGAVIVSNTKWRDGRTYMEDFTAFGSPPGARCTPRTSMHY